MKKRDIILIIVVLALALAGFGLVSLSKKNGDQLQITVDGKVYGVYELDENQTIEIGSTNICQIKDGKATMIWAECRDQICVHHKPIDSLGGSIVCLPNRVFLSVLDDGKEREIDTVVS
ncbi:MAG TPA: NusG domain II-containing protein [Candidatus Pelethocola excrementipullorum]|nr:NusG domain II-containing protein [Candidatus Pelethocola excrementipullorum]